MIRTVMIGIRIFSLGHSPGPVVAVEVVGSPVVVGSVSDGSVPGSLVEMSTVMVDPPVEDEPTAVSSAAPGPHANPSAHPNRCQQRNFMRW